MTKPRGDAVLVVDDDPDIREIIEMVLLSAGSAALTASNGAEALEILHAGAELPRLILLDLMMPVMDGWQFRAAQVKDPELAGIPVVVLSGDGNVARKAAELGCDEYLLKPVSFAELRSTIARHA